ncbi:MAG: DUF4402 domain-containing protein [Chitinophagaceae bacterium]
MKNELNKQHAWITKLLFVVLLSLVSFCSFAQTPTDPLPGDPGSITVFTIQHMSFGAFHPGANGGSIIISTSGSRSVTGAVVPLNMGIPYFQSIFEIEAPEGTIVSILNGPDATLTGSNGGSMSLRLNNSAPASPFSTIVPAPGRTQVNIGGTLTVGPPQVTIPGSYSGIFFITFNQE